MAYETEAERIRKRVKALPFRERAKNWWFYHRFHVLLVVVALALCGYFALTDKTVEDGDYSVLYVTPQEPTEEIRAMIADQISAFGEDINGDGKVSVTTHLCTVDLAAVDANKSENPERDQANLTALEMDLSVCQSGIIVTDTPQALQNHSGIMCYLDGSVPEEGAANWEEMFLPWNSVLPSFPGSDALYVGMRRCWTPAQEETLKNDLLLWKRIQAYKK